MKKATGLVFLGLTVVGAVVVGKWAYRKAVKGG